MEIFQGLLIWLAMEMASKKEKNPVRGTSLKSLEIQETGKAFAEKFQTSDNRFYLQTCKGREEGGFSLYMP